MKFFYLKSELKGTDVPEIVFDNLSEARNNDLKVILYVIKNQEIDPLKLSFELNMSHSAVVSSLLFWADKNLILCSDESSTKRKRKPALTSEIVATFANDPNVQALCRNLQLIFGGSLSENYTNKFISLYVEDFIPVDVILQITQHHININKTNPAYIIKVVRSWYENLGLCSGQQVDEYLALCKKREKGYQCVCNIFSLDITTLKSSDKKIIDSWFEKLKMSGDMIEQSYIRAGHLASIRYCNGILKNWSQKGFSKPSDLQNEISNIMQSSKNIDAYDDMLIQSINNVPVFKNNKKDN